jgi:hypothetical protein
MNSTLTIEQRFLQARARLELSKMSRPALEKTALRLLRTRMEQKNGIQNMLMQNGILFNIEEHQGVLPEIISEETFIELLELQHQAEDVMPTDIMDTGWEDEDLDNDDLMLM